MSKILHEECFGIIPLMMKGDEWYTLLLCHKKGFFWGFPKGHPDHNETEKQTAERELYEETTLKVKKYLPLDSINVSFTFIRDNTHIHKKVRYFVAIVEGNVVIDKNEIQEANWIQLQKGADVATFTTDQDIIKQLNYQIPLLPKGTI